MFLQQTFDKRIKRQNDQSSSPSTQHRPPKIGSIRNDKLEYDRDQQYFSKQDVPVKARQAKEQIRTLVDPDHLGLRRREWNTSISVPANFEREESHERKLLKIKLGFLDHPLPQYQEPRLYQGTQVRDDFAGWNVSNQTSAPMTMKKALLKKTMTAFQNSKLKESQYIRDYVNPLARTAHSIQSGKLRAQQQQQLKQTLKQRYLFNNPTASKQKVQGVVFRLAYQSINKERRDNIQAQAMKTDFQATLSVTQKSKLKLQCRHTGVWQKFQAHGDSDQGDYYAWSCCLNETQDSDGCARKIVDGNKWNLVSFNS